MNVTAIETEYAGQRFRSRLEARWAIFFDCLNVAWQYEPQGFESSGAGRYLPDFRLPDMDLWVEVKGNPDGMRGEFGRLKNVLQKGGPLPLLLLGELPIERDGLTFHPWLNLDVAEGLCRDWGAFVPLKKGGARLAHTLGCDIWLAAALNLGRNHRMIEDGPEDGGWKVESRRAGLHGYPVVAAAYAAARGARFEHGSTGERAVEQYRSARILGRM